MTDTALDYLTAVRDDLKACAANPIRQILRQSVADEDASTIFPNGYYMFHFLPVLNDTVNTIPPLNVSATCSSVQWGLQPASSVLCSQPTILKALPLPPQVGGFIPDELTYSNPYTFDSIAVNLLKLSAGDPLKDAGLKALGHLLHLLQDMSSPAHTHNDAHPHAPYVTQLGDRSSFEVFNENQSHIEGPFPTIFGAQPNVQFNDELDALRQLQAFVSSNFLSEKDALKLDPSVANEFGVFVNAFGPQAILGSDKKFRIREDIAHEQFNRLAPYAVAYTAALIQWVHEHRAPVCEEELQVTVVGKGRVMSSSDGFRNAPNDSLNCTTDCQHYFPSGKSVTLTAVPTNPQQTVTWAGCQASGFTCTLPMDDVAAKTVTATFTAGQVPLTITQSSSQYPGTPGSGSSPGCPNTDLSISVSFSAPVPYVSIAEALNAGAQIFGTGVGTGQGINYHGTQCQFELSTVGPETYNVWFTKNTLGILGIPNNIGISAVTSGTWNITPTGITYSGVYIQDFGAPQVGTISFSINGDIGVAGTTGASASH